jgi:hypothetical protein
MDVKILAMMEGDSFNISAFLEYCINFFLELNPNLTFFSIVNQILNECEISSEYQEGIREKMKKIENNWLINKLLNEQKSKTSFQK